MARRKGDFLVGVIGPVTLRVVNGVQVMSNRIQPGVMKQTAATKQAAGYFGTAAALSSHIYRRHSSPLGNMNDGRLYKRLTTKLVDILNDCRDPLSNLYNFSTESFSSLVGLDFNINSPLRKRMVMLPELELENEMVTLAFPKTSQEIKLKFPPKSNDCEIIATAALFDLTNCKMANTYDWQKQAVNKEEPLLNNIKFKFTVPKVCLCIVSVFLKYYSILHVHGSLVNTKQFSPGGICGAIITPGTFDGMDGRHWLEMDKVKF